LNRTLPLLLLALTAAAPPARPTPTDIVTAAPASAWRTIPAEDLLVMNLEGGARVVIQLAPAFAPVHVSNIRKFATANYWQGAAVYRVQDNYVAQWGSNEA
jgi:peptidylprolyl isomerase